MLITGWTMIKGVTKVSKLVYDNMNSRNIVPQPGRFIWNRELNSDIPSDEWSRLMRYIYSITISTKLRYFQYRVLNPKIVTNYLRSKWEDISDLCTFCCQSTETMIHTFIECCKVKVTWKVL